MIKFIVDAQLPKRLARWLAARGHDVLHTLDLPEQNRTQDADITALACREHRIVVTKDADFVDSFLLQGRPPKLLLIATGNISNQALERFDAVDVRNLIFSEKYGDKSFNLNVHDREPIMRALMDSTGALFDISEATPSVANIQSRAANVVEYLPAEIDEVARGPARALRA